VAISFDDGQDVSYTPDVLNLLEQSDSRATFFLIGEHAESEEGLVIRELRDGMEIGNHTWSHPHLGDLSAHETMWQLRRTKTLLSALGLDDSQLFRAPYGEVGADTLTDIRQQGLLPIHWSIPLDRYVGELPPREAAFAILANVSPGDILLAHDAHDGALSRDDAMATLHILLPLLSSRGYMIVTVGSLLQEGTPVLASPRPWFWQSGFTC
jgi:peptidoglycan/xylan/chitin deacetylase (PgdA/CDA1 family)